MARSVISRLESVAEYKYPALLLVYSLLIMLDPCAALSLGGIALWLYLLYRWLWGGCVG